MLMLKQQHEPSCHDARQASFATSPTTQRQTRRSWTAQALRSLSLLWLAPQPRLMAAPHSSRQVAVLVLLPCTTLLPAYKPWCVALPPACGMPASATLQAHLSDWASSWPPRRRCLAQPTAPWRQWWCSHAQRYESCGHWLRQPCQHPQWPWVVIQHRTGAAQLSCRSLPRCSGSAYAGAAAALDRLCPRLARPPPLYCRCSPSCHSSPHCVALTGVAVQSPTGLMASCPCWKASPSRHHVRCRGRAASHLPSSFLSSTSATGSPPNKWTAPSPASTPSSVNCANRSGAVRQPRRHHGQCVWLSLSRVAMTTLRQRPLRCCWTTTPPMHSCEPC